jgi:integrase
MSRRRRQSYDGCSIESAKGRLRLRYRQATDGVQRHAARATDLDDTPANRAKLRPMAEAVGRVLAARQDPTPVLDTYFPPRVRRTSAPSAPSDTPAPILGPTVAAYYKTWLPAQSANVRPAQARDYKRHFDSYIISTLGPVPLAELRAKDVRALQAELLQRKQAPRKDRPKTKTLSIKTVKNVIGGSLRAMIRQARADELVTRDLFAGLTWPEWHEPEPDPFEVAEVQRICAWFGRKKFGFPPLPGSMGVRHLAHPSFHAYVHTLFHTGLRPSEASGLQWQDIDPARGVLYVRRSFHLQGYNAPKTKSARRTVELLPETVRVLRALQPLNVAPDAPVFLNTIGGAIEPKSFSEHFHKAQRALGLRVRGLYCTKDTYVSHALQTVRDPLYVEQQTGVAYSTLRRHYAKWMPSSERAEVRRLALLFESATDNSDGGGETPELSLSETASEGQSSQAVENEEGSKCEEGDLNHENLPRSQAKLQR